jgi:predicted enzyme related to lactoylglutathione lyase
MTIDLMSPALRHRQQPETLRLRAVMPILSVRDLERSAAWYRDIMGFVISDTAVEDGKAVAVQLMAGKIRFMLVHDDASSSESKGEGLRLCCATRQDIDELAKIVVERGGNVEQEPRNHRGGRDFGVIDPDGYRISISSGVR